VVFLFSRRWTALSKKSELEGLFACLPSSSSLICFRAFAGYFSLMFCSHHLQTFGSGVRYSCLFLDFLHTQCGPFSPSSCRPPFGCSLVPDLRGVANHLFLINAILPVFHSPVRSFAFHPDLWFSFVKTSPRSQNSLSSSMPFFRRLNSLLALFFPHFSTLLPPLRYHTLCICPQGCPTLQSDDVVFHFPRLFLLALYSRYLSLSPCYFECSRYFAKSPERIDPFFLASLTGLLSFGASRIFRLRLCALPFSLFFRRCPPASATCISPIFFQLFGFKWPKRIHKFPRPFAFPP